jgi:hypothetical protein
VTTRDWNNEAMCPLLVAQQVPDQHRFAANSLLLRSSSLLAVSVIGPTLGGVLIAVIGAPAVLSNSRHVRRATRHRPASPGHADRAGSGVRIPLGRPLPA